MNNLTLILKFISISGIFILFYSLFLRRLKCFYFNRIYLILAMFFSIAIPFLIIDNIPVNTSIFSQKIIHQTTIKTETQQNIVTHNLFKENERELSDQESNHPIAKSSKHSSNKDLSKYDYIKILNYIYWTITSILMIKFLISISILINSIRKNPKVKQGNFIYVLKENIASPYTFLHFIFIDKYQFEKEYISEQILLHEQTHAKQWHSLDLIFFELLTTIAWINPFLFIYKKYIKENHEFIADNIVIHQYNEKMQYQYLLLDMQKTQKQYRTKYILTNSFNFSSLKNRLIMINQTNKPSRNLFYCFLTLPLLACCVFLFAQKHDAKKVLKEQTNSENTAINNIYEKGISDEEFNYYIDEMKKGNYKFDPKNRNRDWLKDLKNSPQGDSLISLYHKMTWQQKSLTHTKYHLFTPKLNYDSLSTEDFKQYNIIAHAIAVDNTSKGKDSSNTGGFGYIKNPNKKSKLVIKGRWIRNDSLYEKYAYLNVMTIEMNQRQANAASVLWEINQELRKPKPISPTETQMTKWSKYPKLWGVWLNGKRIPNADLSQYKATDIYYFDASNLTPRAQKNDGFKAQLGLYTKAGYDKVFKDWK